MFSKNELINILLVIIVLTFSVSLFELREAFLYTLVAVFFVIVINVLTKKITAFYLDSEIDIDLWQVRRYGFTAGSYFKKPLQAGVLIPVLTSILTLGNFVWMSTLVFDAKPKVYRAARRFGLYKFSEMTERHLGLIAASGIVINLAFAIIGYILNFPLFAKLNIWIAFFNILPISDLDGNKIFFGSLILWSFLAALTLVATGYSLLIV